MVMLIQDEIDDTTAEYTVQIQDAIFTALRLCEREPFFFNEKRKITFTTQSGKTWYGRDDNDSIGVGVAIGSLFLEHDNAEPRPLLYKSAEFLKKKYEDSPPQGIPIFYTYDDQKIGLFPTPQNADIVHFSYTPFPSVDECSMQDNHPWFTHAFDLIKARAKYELYKNILKDPEYTIVSFNDFQEQLQALRYETSRAKGCSNILATGF
nr:hypothetical protein [Bartonella australis]